MALVQTAQVAEWLGWSADKITERQGDLTRITESASTTIRRWCGRDFTSSDGETRLFSPTMRSLEAPVGDCRSITRVEVRQQPRVDYVLVDPAAYELLPGPYADWPPQTILRTDGAPFPPGPAALRITGDWGFSTVPASIEQATIMLSANLLARAQSPKQIGSSFTGAEADLGSYLDMDIRELCDDYKVGTAAVA